MKLFIVILTVVAFACAEFTEEEHQKWLDFKLEHGKMFLSPGKEKDRMVIFLRNAKAVEEHNKAYEKGEVLYEKQTHKHSDLSDETFERRFGGVKMPAEARTVDPSKLVTLRATPPASVNLTSRIPNWPVRDQGVCGCCWAFSSCATIEYAYWKKTGVVTDTSEQQLLDCVDEGEDGCEGGWMPQAFNYISYDGLTWEKNYPYKSKQGACNYDVTKAIYTTYPRYFTQVASDDTSIKNALNDIGALAICVDSTDWGTYKGGIFSSPVWSNPECKHNPTLVGYGTDATTGVPYWLVRNSWGSAWGELGYIRLDARRDPATGKPKGGIMLEYAYYTTLV